MQTDKLYPIGYVSLATGLSPHVIRVWEKRYAAVIPGRSGKNRRLYSRSDIERLKRLKSARAVGQRIGTAARLDEASLTKAGWQAARSTHPAESQSQSSAPTPDAAGFLSCSIEAAQRMDPAALLAVLRDASVGLSRPAVLAGVVTPLMQHIGAGWVEGSMRIIHEHLAADVVRGYLWEMIRSLPTDVHAPCMVVTTPAGQLCEIGAMMAAVTAGDCGWNIKYYGPNLPAAEIAAAALEEQAAAVGLSVSCLTRAELLERELSTLRQSLGDAVGVFVGGQAAGTYEPIIAAAGGRYVRSIRELSELILGFSNM